MENILQDDCKIVCNLSASPHYLVNINIVVRLTVFVHPVQRLDLQLVVQLSGQPLSSQIRQICAL